MDHSSGNILPSENSSDISPFFVTATELSKEDMLKENMDTSMEKDISGDLSNLDDLEILHSCNDNVFASSNVMDCLSDLPSTEEPFEIPSIDDGEEQQVLPVYGPLCEFETQSSYEANVVDPSAVPGICGLRNLGNTCFMNAGLQCLLNNKIFKSYFVEGNFELNGKDSLTYKFAELMKNVWSGSYSTLHLGDFKECFGKIHSQFRNFRQHDCQEFLALLLDTMHEELNCVNQAKLGMLLEDSEPSACVSYYCERPNDSQAEKILTEIECNKQIQISDKNPIDAKCEKVNEVSLLTSKKCELSTLNIALDTGVSKVGSSENRLKNLIPANNAKQIKHATGTVKKKNILESEAAIYERNTEKMADLLINNNKLDRILNKNELEVTHNAPSEVHSSQKVKTVQRNHICPQNSTNDGKLEKNELAYKLNSARKIPSIDDFVKDTKTLNTNMLVSGETNNLFKFDSEKFPKHEPYRLQETVDNLGQIMDFGAKQSGLKRVKMTNIMHENPKFIENNVDSSTSSCFALHKRLKIENIETKFESPSIEQDDVVDMEQMHDECSEESSQSSELNSECRALSFAEEIRRAYNHWDKYKMLNQSVIVNTFHGQFRSSVVCSQCSHVSITYEPFMYLPVFLPHALERQIVITFVQNNGTSPVRYLVNVNKYERVHKIREALQKHLDTSTEEIVLAEVFENHVSRFLDENMSIRRVNDSSRSVYAFEVGKNTEKDVESLQNATPIPLSINEEKKELKSYAENFFEDSSSVNTSEKTELSETCDTFEVNKSSSPPSFLESKMDDEFSINDRVSKIDTLQDIVPEGFLSPEDNIEIGPVQWHSCAICLEELPDVNLMFHPNCDCILCHNCIEVSCKHYGGDNFICPVCSSSVSPTEDFVPLNKMGDYKFKISTIPIPIVIRHDSFEGETLKNKTLVGHPALLKLPSSLSATTLYEHVDNAIPFLSTYSLLLVDGQGKNCSRCLYNQHCSGCEISRVGDIKLQPGDSLAVRYMDLSKENLESASYAADHKSMQQTRHKTSLDIYDCLESFSERERLDEDSPWFCPVCRQNQQATKSLSIWKFPEVLIICLKRFVFLDYASMKVEEKVTYPLEGLDLSSFSSGPFSGDLIYDLQACICHFGGLSAGHYTSYSKHAVTNEWYYFNDENVRKEAPKIEECVNEYILFYQKR